MLPLARTKVTEYKLCLSVHIPLNVAKLTGPHFHLQMDNEAEYTKNILLLPVCFLHYFPSLFFSFLSVFDRRFSSAVDKIGSGT